ncbi:50S ribosomal protein L13 [Methanobrevibacter cuticularis]|uniref:Large ribosomal subunit protein uL13 n=2 Tax=Methanobrevibacter cuticularis TaxID=47311 RepID=A0A166FJL5_9EURY|nr:50S ribosomal protein L13 [Methanobrevibacter cuticularis]
MVLFMIINGEGHILGRLASVISKKLLDGEEIVVLNAEKILITGSKEWAYAKYKQRVDRASISNPRDMGPKYPRRPEEIFRRTVRGMLPYKKSKGRVAFKGLKAYVGVPREFQESETSVLSQAEYQDIKKGIELGEISKLLGAKF